MGNAPASSAVAVRAVVTTDGVTVGIGSADMVTGEPVPPLAIEPFTLARDTMPLAADDRRIEEHPRRLTCGQSQKAPAVIHATGATPAQAQADAQQQAQVMNEQYNVTHAGVLTAMVRVNVDGKPGSQLRVINITNPSAVQSLGDPIGSCRYAPARVLGVAVPAFFKVSMGAGGIVQ